MAKRKRRDRQAVGAQWRALMTEECESLQALVWKRVHRLHRVDLSDPAQATDLQVYHLLRDLMDTRSTVDCVEVAREELEAFIDSQVPRVFG